MISADDRRGLDSGDPSYETLKRVFYIAMPAMEKISIKMGKDVFDINVLREFYSNEHNERKFKEGELICLAFPAKILENAGRNYEIELEPVKGRFRIESDIEAGVGDWVVMHRINLIERIPEEFALKMAVRLQNLGLDKTYKFPKVAIKYLKALKESSNRRYNGNQQKNKGPSTEGQNKAQVDSGRQKETTEQGSGEVYA